MTFLLCFLRRSFHDDHVIHDYEYERTSGLDLFSSYNLFEMSVMNGSISQMGLTFHTRNPTYGCVEFCSLFIHTCVLNPSATSSITTLKPEPQDNKSDIETSRLHRHTTPLPPPSAYGLLFILPRTLSNPFLYIQPS
jgi:hypothetical protein